MLEVVSMGWDKRYLNVGGQVNVIGERLGASSRFYIVEFSDLLPCMCAFNMAYYAGLPRVDSDLIFPRP